MKKEAFFCDVCKKPIDFEGLTIHGNIYTTDGNNNVVIGKIFQKAEFESEVGIIDICTKCLFKSFPKPIKLALKQIVNSEVI